MESPSSKSIGLTAPVVLPYSGRPLPNRLVKAAMTEGLADPNTGQPNHRHASLYQSWNQGCGMVITGNVMIDRLAREAPRNVVLDGLNKNLAPFRDWASVIQQEGGGALAIMQLSHPGRQSPLAVTGLFGPPPVAPSVGTTARVKLPGLLGGMLGRLLLRTPRELSVAEIQDIVAAFADAAELAEQAGFAGIQLHAAHGYLLSQFLSRTINRREDEYGGNATKRRKLLVDVIAAVREATSKSFVVGVKVNSRDARTSNDGNERIDLIQELCSEQHGLDFIEISGGSFEDGLMVQNVQARVDSDEGFFLPFAKRLQTACNNNANANPENASPLIMLTGGFRTRAGMESALRSGAADLIGLARPLVLEPTFAQDLLLGRVDSAPSYSLSLGFADAVLVPALNSLWHQQQMARLSEGKNADPTLGFAWTITGMFVRSYVWDPSWNSQRTTLWVGFAAVIVTALFIHPLFLYFQNAPLFSSASSFLENWLSLPWLCWGVGPLIAVNCGTYVTAVFLEVAICDGVSLISYGKEPRRVALSKEPSVKEQLMRALATTIGPVAIANAALLAVLMTRLVPGPYPLFFPECSMAVFKLLSMLVLNDFFLYWGHRIQHESRFLWQFHAVHHQFRTPRPLTTAVSHPIDATLQAGLPMILSTIICQPHPWLMYLFLFLRTSENVLNHSGSDSWWVCALLKSNWLPLRAGVDHHDWHHLVCNHANGATNYGESFIVWDWLFGTLAPRKKSMQA